MKTITVFLLLVFWLCIILYIPFFIKANLTRVENNLISDVELSCINLGRYKTKKYTINCNV